MFNRQGPREPDYREHSQGATLGQSAGATLLGQHCQQLEHEYALNETASVLPPALSSWVEASKWVRLHHVVMIAGDGVSGPIGFCRGSRGPTSHQLSLNAGFSQNKKRALRFWELPPSSPPSHPPHTQINFSTSGFSIT